MEFIKYNNIVVEYSYETATNLRQKNIAYEVGYLCKECGEFVKDWNAITIKDGDTRYNLCNKCFEKERDKYFYCGCCATYHLKAKGYNEIDDSLVCEECFNDYYRQCEFCGEYVHEDDIYYCQHCDTYYCEHCLCEHERKHNDGLYSYHSFNNWIPKAIDNETPNFYIGHELEIDNGSDRYEVVQMITNELPCICMRDGSLSNASGIEIISHPMSYSYLLSIENDYKRIFEKLTNDYNYKSHETNTCGLHFHVTRPTNEEVIDRIILFMETYKEEIIKLSRRRESEREQWCKFLSDVKYDVDDKQIKSLDYIKKYKEKSIRTMALNLTNRDTIEFRLFKGTLKFETFMSAFEFVYNLVTACSDLSIPISKLTWRNITKEGKYLPTYIKEKDITTNKIIKDYSRLLQLEQKRRKAQLKKDYNELYKEVIGELHNISKITKRVNINKLINTNRISILNNYLYTINTTLKAIESDKNDVVKMTTYDLTRAENDAQIIKNKLREFKQCA